MLRDDIDHGTVKALIVSKLAFRRLVYERSTISDGLPQGGRTPSKQEFLGEIEHNRSVLHNFLRVELKALPVANQPKVETASGWIFNTLEDIIGGEIEDAVNRVFDAITERGLRDTTALEADISDALNSLVSRRAIDCFVKEIVSLVSSSMTFLEWCGSVRYRSVTDFGGEATNDGDIVIVDDSVEDPPSRPERPHLHRRPVFNPFFNTGLRNPFVNHVSYPNISAMINAPLYLGPPVNPFLPPRQAQNIPSPGVFWADLTRPAPGPNRSNNVDVVDLSDDEDGESGESEEYDGVEVEADDVQVLNPNGAITLDETMESEPSESSSNRRGRKRKSEENQLERAIRSDRAAAIPDGFCEDLQDLMAKYNIHTDSAMEIISAATQEIVERKPSPPKRAAGGRPASSFLSTDETPQKSAFSKYIAKHGLGP
ncbi:unnamed protein product [Caenorhabditis sp. 36 PRJEB53466]|nr:unnamed protein product [Caenorhabditis sp. 36 PRJEB53466]